MARAVSVVFMGVHYEVDVDCGGYEWIIQTTDYVERGAGGRHLDSAGRHPHHEKDAADEPL